MVENSRPGPLVIGASNVLHRVVCDLRSRKENRKFQNFWTLGFARRGRSSDDARNTGVRLGACPLSHLPEVQVVCRPRVEAGTLAQGSLPSTQAPLLPDTVDCIEEIRQRETASQSGTMILLISRAQSLFLIILSTLLPPPLGSLPASK